MPSMSQFSPPLDLTFSFNYRRFYFKSFVMLLNNCFVLFFCFLKFNSTVNSLRSTQTLPSMSTLLVTSGLLTATTVAAAGISSSMAPSAALLGLLMVHSTCGMEGSIVFTVTATLKVTVITFTRERCEWDSGLESVQLVERVLTQTRAGVQCPGSSLKRCQKLSSKHMTRDQLDFSFNKSLLKKMVENN